MKKEDIIRMAIDAGWDAHHADFDTRIKTFAALVAFAEREACEALHDHEDVQAPVGNSSWGEAYQEGWGQGTAAYRDAIKARGQA
jgi:hypothetical protein